MHGRTSFFVAALASSSLLLAAQSFVMPSAPVSRSPAGIAARRPLAIGTSNRRGAPLAAFFDPQVAQDALSSILLLADDAVAGSVTDAVADAPSTYSKYSYYTTLGLYALSFPGLISLVTRSVKSKDVRRTFEAPGPNAKEGKGKELKVVAGEVMAYFLSQNYQISENKGSAVTFKGVVGKSKSQAFFLTFCTFMGLISLALVLSIQFQEIGEKWFYITLASPYAGLFYWQRAAREDTVTVSLETPDDTEEVTNIVAVGNKEELERMATTLNYGEKGMVRVQGIFEST